MNILFINSNLAGHIHPTLGFVKELAKRGHSIDYYCSEQFEAQLQQCGVKRIPFSKNMEQFLATYIPPVPDRMLAPGFHPQLDNCYTILQRICETYGIDQPTLKEVFVCKGERNMVYTTKSFNCDNDISSPEYLFAGPNTDRLQDLDGIDLAAPGERKIVYISLGSFNTNFMDFYQMCIAAFKETEYYVYMSIGKKCDISQLGEIPDNFYVDNYLPQLAILSHADVFVTHAGFNSVNEALYFGVPMLALPLVNDQSMVAKRLATLELGLAEDFKTLTAQQLKEQADVLTSDTKFRENCLKMSEEMQDQAQLDQAVDELEQYYNRQNGE